MQATHGPVIAGSAISFSCHSPSPPYRVLEQLLREVGVLRSLRAQLLAPLLPLGRQVAEDELGGRERKETGSEGEGGRKEMGREGGRGNREAFDGMGGIGVALRNNMKVRSEGARKAGSTLMLTDALSSKQEESLASLYPPMHPPCGLKAIP